MIMVLMQFWPFVNLSRSYCMMIHVNAVMRRKFFGVLSRFPDILDINRRMS